MKDVFIIGAGCSVPYGFPTGAMLMQNLKVFSYKEHFEYTAQHLLDHHYLFDLYPDRLYISFEDYKKKTNQINGYGLSLNFEKKTINDIESSIVKSFAKSIRHSMMVSTDEFLKNRLNQEKAEEADFGKRLIAREILISERDSENSFIIEDGKRVQKKQWLGNIDWIQHFLSRIDQQPNWEKILKQTVFLSFNYDRVLEYCIFLYLTSDKQYVDAAAHSFINEMQIFHVNGYIGSLEKVPFGDVENGKYQEIARGMETVWEKRLNRDETEKEKYQEFLKNAERVYFLGFSYIPDNLESIGINRGAGIIHNAKVYATAMGLSAQNRLRISSYLNLKDFEKRSEPESIPEIQIERTPFMTDIMYQQEYERKEKEVKYRIKSARIYYENRILKDASAMDLILDYYTFD